MKDFLIKLLGGYRAIIVIIEKGDLGTRSVSHTVEFYPFVQMIYKTKLGTVVFKKDKSVEFYQNRK